MKIGKYPVNDYIRLAESFHANLSPGMLMGGIMVNAAFERIDHEKLHDAICETSSCLPDAIELLTPCTIGNGWLHIVDLVRFALTLYEKDTGRGIRVFLDVDKIEAWPEVKSWFLKLKPKREQNREALTDQMVEASISLCGIITVRVLPLFLQKRGKGEIAHCPVCGEAYPKNHGPVCRGCTDRSPYIRSAQRCRTDSRHPSPLLKTHGHEKSWLKDYP